MQSYNTFHQANGQKVADNSEEKKKKDLENKIDSFCESSFQKLKIPHLGDNKNIGQPKSSYQDIDELD
jgi:hypothetical protein